MTKKVIFLLALLSLFWSSVGAVDTLYIRQTDTIVIRETRYQKVPVATEKEVQPVVQEATKDNCDDKVFFVYFPLGSYGLDDAAQKAVQEMAVRMAEFPTKGLLLTGYCDYVGSGELNDRLSVARAKNVRNQLINVHGIAANRITVEGKGKLDNVKSQYGPNRRVEMRLVDNISNSYAEVGPYNSSPKVGGVPEGRRSMGKSQNPLAERGKNPVQLKPAVASDVKLLATETVDQYTTLSRLARKYYNNTFCWVYIYAMNKSVIPNPNSLQVGQQLRIPVLGEVDKQITKQESEEYYKMLRR